MELGLRLRLTNNSFVHLCPKGYTEEVNNDGSKVFICKHCEKTSKTEQGIKMHNTTKHKKQAAEKRKLKEGDTDDDHDDKKARFTSVLNGPDVSEYEFDPLDMETSSQIGDHLDRTSDIVPNSLETTQNKVRSLWILTILLIKLFQLVQHLKVQTTTKKKI